MKILFNNPHCEPFSSRHCEPQSGEAIQQNNKNWIASSSTIPRNDGGDCHVASLIAMTINLP
ncbi:MAG: hypothetical protein RLZZ59_771 [Pseudomonadota bacterium]|jgi:hypothetical protein